MSLSVQEQEVHINFGRSDEFATIYCTDITWITKMDKLVQKSPDLYKVVRQNESGKTYRFPKRLVSLRSSVVKREYTEEQRQQMAERVKKARDKRNAR